LTLFTMRLSVLLLASITTSVQGMFIPRTGLKILISNDDGWAEANIRAHYNALTSAGYKVLVSAPVQNQSGSGSLDATPKVMTEPGQFDSVPVGAPAIGSNVTDPRLNYVNSYPVTSVKYGISTISPAVLGGAPDFVVTGPNLGMNLGPVTLMSGTIGAAAEAIKEGIPAIAFSGATGDERSYTELVPGDYSQIYAEVAAKVLNAVIASGPPYLPADTGLNVNIPAISSICSSVSSFTYVLTRIYWDPLRSDVTTCGSNHLPTESHVVGDTNECQVSISPFKGSNKLDSAVAEQTVVLDKLAHLVTCAAKTGLGYSFRAQAPFS